MKRMIVYVALMLLICAVCTGCGEEDDRRALAVTAVRKDEQQIPFPEESGNYGWHLLGMQYYQGEAVQIWGVQNAGKMLDIYLYREDGSREELLSDAPLEYGGKWFLDHEGNRFLLLSRGRIVRLDKDGRELYSRGEDAVEDICQLSDGRILVILWREGGGYRLAELDPLTGVTNDIKEVALKSSTKQYISAGEDGLLLMDTDGVWRVNLNNGGRESLMEFGTTYSLGDGVQDFRLLEDGRMELLHRTGRLHTLELYDPVGDREIIFVRGPYNRNMVKYAFWFNEANEDYYVHLEPYLSGVSFLDYRTRTLVELGSGKGPDILCQPMLEDLWGAIENGYLENLTPWIEKSDMEESDYFPAAFAYPRVGEEEGELSGLYGIRINVAAEVCYMAREVIGEGVQDIRGLADALTAYEGDGVFENMNTQSILDYFLGGSEDLWGMLDWEKGSCDFSDGLLAEILQIAKRYADDGKDNMPVLLRQLYGENYYDYDYEHKEYEANGMVQVNYFFDDGQYARQDSYPGWMVINSNSPNKEGAWAFLQFLLSDQVQSAMIDDRDYNTFPVSRKSYDDRAALALEEGVFIIREDEEVGRQGIVMGRYVRLHISKEMNRDEYKSIFDPTEEKIAEVKKVLENVKAMPLKTGQIMDIISEEAEDYFSGMKSAEEVISVMQNRVQLYLDEHQAAACR